VKFRKNYRPRRLQLILQEKSKLSLKIVNNKGGGNSPFFIKGSTMGTDIKIVQDEKVITKLKPPSMWKVVFHNDDYTPMDLVIDILRKIFKHHETSAKEITLEIHNTGAGIAGIYTYEVAEQKGLDATFIARENGAPLKITIEEEQ
jgi:ATP-dependent Clp protease adaptor protein ClpS